MKNIKSGGTADDNYTASVLKSIDFWTGAFLYKGGDHCVNHRRMAMALAKEKQTSNKHNENEKRGK